MGQFSWILQDIEKPLSSVGGGTAVMTDDKGNQWNETDYEGYGVFGGKDYYELLAEMNGQSGRDAGISLAFDGDPTGRNPKVKHPNLTRYPNWTWVAEVPLSDPNQGWGNW